MKLIIMRDDGELLLGAWLYRRRGLSLFVWSRRLDNWRLILGSGN